jgi:hypothetical protein
LELVEVWMEAGRVLEHLLRIEKRKRKNEVKKRGK